MRYKLTKKRVPIFYGSRYYCDEPVSKDGTYIRAITGVMYFVCYSFVMRVN